MDLKSIMQRYGQELGMPEGIPSNNDGAYELSITDELTVVARNLNPGIELFCNLGQFSFENEAKLFQELMAANLMGISTRGAILGLSADGKNTTLYRELSDDLPYQNFMEGLDDFCNVAETWHNNVRGR